LRLTRAGRRTIPRYPVRPRRAAADRSTYCKVWILARPHESEQTDQFSIEPAERILASHAARRAGEITEQAMRETELVVAFGQYLAPAFGPFGVSSILSGSHFYAVGENMPDKCRAL
jgi:hypothetical protein